ncbi:MAG: protein kinase [Cyanobacteriota bacterium]|nr:protein kinase [Cyanobacteriota bacterium]
MLKNLHIWTTDRAINVGIVVVSSPATVRKPSNSMRVTSTISPGTLIDRRYRIQRVLGRGGMGRTYLVADERCFGDRCVLKEFLPPQMDGAVLKKARQLFEREARVLHQLVHPQIPRLLACFEEDGLLFLVEEYIEGQNYQALLDQRLATGEGGFSEAETICWLEEVLPVLEYIHHSHAIHRDISPDNIMRSRHRNCPVLIDFGVVKQAITEVRVQSPQQTLSTAFVGKVGYAPPEQIRMGQCFPSSDLYSLAVTALVLLSGKPPSELYDSRGMQWQWRENVRVSEAFARILTKMLAERPQDRYQSATEAREALASLARLHQSLVAMPPSTHAAIANIPSTHRRQNLLSPRSAIANIIPVATQSDAQISEVKVSNSKFYTQITAALSTLTAVILTGIIVGMRSPYIPFLCKPLNSCARDEEFQQFYARVLQKETTTRLLSRPPQTVEDLQNTRDRLRETLVQLRSIPDDVNVRSEAQPLVAYYRNELERVENRLATEKSAAEALAAIEQRARSVARATSLASTQRRLEQAKANWEDLLGQLEEIPDETFVGDRVRQLRGEYREQLNKVEDKLERQ